MLATKRADTVTTADVARLSDTLSADYAASSVATALAYLSAAYSWAVREGLLTTPSPCRCVERPTSEPSLDVPSRAEVAALLSHAQTHAQTHAPDLHPMLATAISTGRRERCDLHWCDIDVPTRQLEQRTQRMPIIMNN